MAKYRLLSVEDDVKTSKGTKYGYLTGILYLAPANEAGPDVNLCPASTSECREACLYTAGLAQVFPVVKKGRIAKTREFLNDPSRFVETLSNEIVKLRKDAVKRGLKPAVRLNGTSDLPKLATGLAPLFPDVQFYDYTKLPRPWERIRSNYHITFSYSGTNLEDSLLALKNNVNVAVVFTTDNFPSTWNGYPVIDGDLSDLRFLDKAGSIVGLKAKGTARSMKHGGFIQLAA